MKAKVLIVLGCLGMLISNVTFAQDYYSDDTPTQYGCSSCAPVAAVECPRSCHTCGCTDPGCSNNPCVSSQRYCSLFGNIGGGDFSDQIAQDY